MTPLRERLVALLRRIRSERAGSILPLAGAALAVLCGCAGLGIDLGMVYLEKRRVQAAADLAALAAVRAIGSPGAAAQALADNGYPEPSHLGVTPGLYTPNRALSPEARFAPGAAAPNAVRVSLGSQVRAGFSRVVGGPASYAVSARSTARQADLAAFGIGSRLVGLDGGILNALLSGLLGTRVSLSAMSYQALAGLDVDALSFLRAAALRGNIRAATFDDVLAGSLSLVDLISALDTAAEGGGAGAAGALSSLTGALSGTTRRVPLDQLLTVGEIGAAPLASPGTPLTVNALGLLTAAAALANGTDQVSVDLGTGIPGLAQARVSLRIGQGWQSSGYVSPGARLGTAQTRALVEVGIGGLPGLPNLTVPIYLELAQGSATLRRVACPWSSDSERAVTLDVATGAAFLAIGAVDGSTLASVRPPLAPATILRAPLLSVTASANRTIGSGQRSLTFTDADIRAGRLRTVSATELTGSLVGTLLTTLNLGVNGTPLGGVLPLQAAIGGVLGQAAGPIDALLFSVLGSLGLRIGAADVAVTGTRCGGAVLVQ